MCSSSGNGDGEGNNTKKRKDRSIVKKSTHPPNPEGRRNDSHRNKPDTTTSVFLADMASYTPDQALHLV
jgi:hypothetical protein